MANRMLKLLVATVLGISLIFAAAVCAKAMSEEEIVYNVEFNGKYLEFDQRPVNINGRILVPMRQIFEVYDASIEWDEVNQKVTANTAECQIILTVDSKYAYIDGEKYEMDAPATIVGGRTVVPVRFISEALRAEVGWDAGTNTVIINAEIPNEVISKEEPTDEPEETQDDFDYPIYDVNDIIYDKGFFSTQEGISGACHLTCLGMISSNLNNAEITASMVYAANGYTCSLPDWYGLLDKLNIKRTDSLNLKQLSSNEKIEKVVELLKQNPEGVVIRFLNGSRSHYVVCKGFSGGKLVVNDPVGQIYVTLDKCWVGYSMFNSYDDAIKGLVLVEAYNKGSGEVAVK